MRETPRDDVLRRVHCGKLGGPTHQRDSAGNPGTRPFLPKALRESVAGLFMIPFHSASQRTRSSLDFRVCVLLRGEQASPREGFPSFCVSGEPIRTVL